MLHALPQTPSVRLAICLLVLSCFGVFAVSYGKQSLENPYFVTQEIRHLNENSDFPVEFNAPILSELNKYLATQGGKQFVRKALARKTKLDPMFEAALKRYDLPEELLAVGLVESGYHNAKPNPARSKGAGIWQFIPTTAKHFGLAVDQSNDERTHVEKSTDGAMRFLKSLHLQFGDWRLAIMAYNAGPNKIQQGIHKTGSRDPWHLAESGFEGDRNYLAKVMAGVLILKKLELSHGP